LDENGFIDDWVEVAQQATRPEVLTTDWQAVDFPALKHRLATLITTLTH